MQFNEHLAAKKHRATRIHRIRDCLCDHVFPTTVWGLSHFQTSCCYLICEVHTAIALTVLHYLILTIFAKISHLHDD